MTSEIRTNSLKSRAGLSTVTLTDSGPMFSGITTFVDNSGFNIGTGSSIFSPAANTLTFGTNSNERFRITADGKVGVGTNNPSQEISIWDDSPAIRLVDTNPYASAQYGQIAQSGGILQLSARGDGATHGGIYFYATNNSETLNLYRTSDNTHEWYTASSSNSMKMRLLDSGRLGIGTANPDRIFHITTASPIIKLTDSDNSLSAEINGSSGNIYLDTHNSNRDIIFRGATTEVARITGDGKVGIGSAVPKTDLDIGNTAGGTITLSTLDNSMTTDQTIGKINFYTTDPSGDGEQNSVIISAHAAQNLGAGGYLKFSTAAGGTGSEGADAVERLRIRSDGKVALGTSTPSSNSAAYMFTVADPTNSLGNCGITIRAGTGGGSNTNQGSIFYSNATSGAGEYAGYLQYNHNDNWFRIGTNSAEKFRITSGGLVGINHDTTGASTNAPLTIKNSTNSSATRFNLVNSGSSQVESTQIYSQNNDLAFVAGANEALRIKDTGTVEFKGGDQGIDAIAVRSENGGASIQISNFRGVTDTNDSNRLGVGKNNNALIFMNASGSQVDTFAIGNTDAVPLVFSTANTERVRIRESGNVELAQNVRLESKPNGTWGAGLFVGGNGNAVSSTHGSMVVTNGNLHLDSRDGSYGVYLNWYGGGNGTYFGNGAGGQRGRIDGSGNLSLSGSYPGSDLRLKENIQNISGALDTIKSLSGKTFTWKTESGLDDWKHYGFIAQEVQQVIPDLVKDIGCHYFDKDDKLVTDIEPTESDKDRKNKGLTQSLTVNNEGVTPILVEAMKELIAEIESLKQDNITLRTRITNLES